MAVPRAGAASVAVPQAGAASVPLPQSHQRKITRYQVFGRVLCVRAFQRVWGIGSARFRAVRKAVCSGAQGPYADLRYRKKPLENKVRCLPEVTSFLEEVYETEAECLPENVEGVDAPWK